MRARIIILPLVAVILLSVTALLQNLPMIYADNLENQPPINDMSDHVATLSTSPPPNAAQQQQQLQQLTQQTQQPFQPPPPPPQTLIPPYNTISDNDNTANMGISNSNPRSSIKVTSVDQQVPPFPSVPISTSSPPNAAQQQLQHQIQQILTLSSYVPSNTNSLSTSNSNSQSSIKIASVVPPFPSVPISTSSPPNTAQQQQQLQQLTQQTQQPFQPPPQTLIPPYNTISDNDNTANMGISNSNPRSSIKVTSVDQQVPPFPSVPISTSSPTTLLSQNDRSQATNYSGNDHQSIPNLVVNGGSPVTLDGSQSYDPDGNQITFAWTQTAGPSVIISDANTSKAKFTVPNLDIDKIMLFKLTVTDENGLSDSGIVQVTVIPSTSPSLGSSMN